MVGSEFKAGSFVLAALFLCGLFIWIVGGERQLFSSKNEYTAIFSDVKGLNVGAPVRLGGITVGRVKDIGFSGNPASLDIRVNFLVNGRYIDRIREGSVATLQTQGLLGDRFLNISSEAVGNPVPRGGEIKTEDPGDIGEILMKAGSAASDAAKIAENLNTLITETKEKTIPDLTRGAKSLANILEEVEKGNGVLHALVYDESGGDSSKSFNTAFVEIGNAARSVNEILSEVKAGKGLMHTLFYGEAPKDLDQVFTKLNDAVTHFKAASEALASGQGTLGALIIDPSLYDNLVEVTDEAKRSFLIRQAIRSTLHD